MYKRLDDDLKYSRVEIRVYTDANEESLCQIEILDDKQAPKSGLANCKLTT